MIPKLVPSSSSSPSLSLSSSSSSSMAAAFASPVSSPSPYTSISSSSRSFVSFPLLPWAAFRDQPTTIIDHSSLSQHNTNNGNKYNHNDNNNKNNNNSTHVKISNLKSNPSINSTAFLPLSFPNNNIINSIEKKKNFVSLLDGNELDKLGQLKEKARKNNNSLLEPTVEEEKIERRNDEGKENNNEIPTPNDLKNRNGKINSSNSPEEFVNHAQISKLNQPPSSLSSLSSSFSSSSLSFPLFSSPPSCLPSLPSLACLDFNPFGYSEDVLIESCVLMMDDLGLLSEFEFSLSCLQCFLVGVRSNYRSNPYHNYYHAWSVFQFAYWTIKNTSLAGCLSKLDQLALVISSLCHDIDHPGTTNTFQINAASELALAHNDQAVLENHHAYTTFALLRDPRMCIFSSNNSNLSSFDVRTLRRLIILAILSTDMAHHFEVCRELDDCEADCASIDWKKDSDRQFIINLITHSSDLSGQVYPLSIAQEWERRVTAEFIQQSLLEVEFGLPLTSYLQDLHREEIRWKNHINFIDFVMWPLWAGLVEMFPQLKICLINLINNRKVYQDMLNQAKEEEERNHHHQQSILQVKQIEIEQQNSERRDKREEKRRETTQKEKNEEKIELNDNNTTKTNLSNPSNSCFQCNSNSNPHSHPHMPPSTLLESPAQEKASTDLTSIPLSNGLTDNIITILPLDSTNINNKGVPTSVLLPLPITSPPPSSSLLLSLPPSLPLPLSSPSSSLYSSLPSLEVNSPLFSASFQPKIESIKEPSTLPASIIPSSYYSYTYSSPSDSPYSDSFTSPRSNFSSPPLKKQLSIGERRRTSFYPATTINQLHQHAIIMQREEVEQQQNKLRQKQIDQNLQQQRDEEHMKQKEKEGEQIEEEEGEGEGGEEEEGRGRHIITDQWIKSSLSVESNDLTFNSHHTISKHNQNDNEINNNSISRKQNGHLPNFLPTTDQSNGNINSNGITYRSPTTRTRDRKKVDKNNNKRSEGNS